jgi:hypothetical protein
MAPLGLEFWRGTVLVGVVLALGVSGRPLLAGATEGA